MHEKIGIKGILAKSRKNMKVQREANVELIKEGLGAPGGSVR